MKDDFDKEEWDDDFDDKGSDSLIGSDFFTSPEVSQMFGEILGCWFTMTMQLTQQQLLEKPWQYVERNSYPNVAILPQGGSEGRPVRAREPLPQVNDSRNHSADGAEPPGRRLSSLTQSLRSHGRPLQRHHMTHHERRKQPVGFRVSFSRPYRSKGTNMGGAYLVGVVSSGFSGFNERNVLQSSHHFWGIDDSGNKYEGPYSGHSSRGLRRIGPFRGMDVDVRGGRRPERVLFGSRDVITVLYDPGSRALSFWKDDVPMGTLVYGVRSDVLYPVAVPFNCGVTVAITSISADPNAV